MEQKVKVKHAIAFLSGSTWCYELRTGLVEKGIRKRVKLFFEPTHIHTQGKKSPEITMCLYHSLVRIVICKGRSICTCRWDLYMPVGMPDVLDYQITLTHSLQK